MVRHTTFKQAWVSHMRDSESNTRSRQRKPSWGCILSSAKSS